MPNHVEESDSASPALGRVHPISGPGIIGDIALAAIPDIKPVERVIQNRQPDPEQFQTDYEGEAAQELNLFGIGSRPFGREGVRDERNGATPLSILTEVVLLGVDATSSLHVQR